MTIPILTTKLYKPAPREHVVERPRLLASLEQARNHQLTLVSAPAGFGKTTLLSNWASENDLPVAWLSLDEADNDAVIFLRYLIAALQTIFPDVGQSVLALLHTSQLVPQEILLSNLINELLQNRGDFFLVLDDYHAIQTQQVHAMLEYLSEHQPPGMHLILSTRSDPPLAISRLRVRNQLVEIRQSDLRMNPAEAVAFLTETMDLQLSSEQVVALEARTEGWVAGLQLAAISMRRRTDVDQFISEFGGSHRFVIDYLADEVLAQQPAEIQSFLLKTAILERFTASLCDLITGRNDSAAVLRHLEESNMFLIPLDERRQWFRYHQLFRDYLSTAEDQLEIGALHSQASRWFMTQGYPDEAVKHALASQDIDLAVYTIEQVGATALQQAAIISLSAWLEALPDQVVRQNSLLSIYQGFIYFFTQNYQQGFSYVQAAQENLPADAPDSLRGKLMSLQAHMALCTGQLDQGISFARDAQEYLADEDTFFRNLTLNVLGQILEMNADVPAAAAVYRQAFHTGMQSGERLGTMVVFTNLIYSLNELGRRTEGVALCQDLAEQLGEETLSGKPLKDAVSLSWSMLSYEANQIETARQQAQAALDTLTKLGVAQGVPWAQYLLARIHMIKGEWEDMLRMTQAGYKHAVHMGTIGTHGVWFKALDAEASLLRGDLAAAERWVESAGHTPQDTPHHWQEWSYFTYIHLLLAQERVPDVRQLLATLEASATNGKRYRKLITIHLLQARADLIEGNMSRAIDRLEKAIQSAAPQDYIRAVLDEGPSISALLPRVRHAAPRFIDQLVGAPTPHPAASTQMLVEPLTERELEVLQLVARGLSNRQIADQLFVTLGTVKKHLNNIFSKLQVKNRTEAVLRGRELSLLD